MGALDRLTDWDVPAVAAAVFDSASLRERHGDIERPFALASVSKVLTAVTTHVAVEEGSIGLDDAAGPEGSTVRHLLAHASGLAPDGEHQVLGPPERKRIYSNLGFEVLAHHLESSAGMTYEEYARLAVVDTLGLAHTDVSGSPAHAHRSSVHDLCNVLQSVVGGHLLAPSTVAAMTTPTFPGLAGVLPGYGAQDPNPWGLGVEIRGHKDPHWTSVDNSPRTWGHFGRAGTFVWFDPDVDFGLVVLTDRDFGPWAIEAWPTLSSDVLSEHR